jgi:RHS repeat-associated protein
MDVFGVSAGESGDARAHASVFRGGCMGTAMRVLGLLGLWMFANTAWAGVELQEFSIDPSPPDAQPLPREPLVAINPPPHDPEVGTAPGVADTEGGASTYRVPLVVPPGRAGLQPELAVVYHSRGGNGLGGMGVSLAGLGSIHRCPQTIEQDGAARAVKYDANDRLCLDGQRLVLVSGSTYGANGAVYRTEVDDFARVTQIGALTGTATCFKVELQSGRIRSYGAPVSGAACSASTRSARVQPSGAPATLSWLLEKEEDRVGNNVFYAYWNFGYGEVLISSIDYTGFGTAIGGRRVTFVHSPRPTSTSAGVIDNDVSASFLTGGLTMQTQRLTQIDTWVGSEHVRAYKLGYVDLDQPARSVSQYSGRSLLQSVTECAYGPTEVCHPPTGMLWEDGPVTYTLRPPAIPSLPTLADLRGTPTTAPGDPSPAPDQRLKTIGDLDGDGGQEVLLTVGGGQTAKSYLLKPRPDRTFAAAVNVTDLGIGSAPWNFVDFDGDGRADIARIQASGDGLLHLWTWKLERGGWSTDPNALFRDVATTIPHTSSQYPSYYADFDGDGRTDVLFSTPDPVCGSDSSGAKWRLKVYLNRIQGSLAGGAAANFVLAAETNGPLCLSRGFSNGLPTYSEAAFRASDFDGDGRADIFIGGGNPPNRQRIVYVRSGGADALTYDSLSMATIGLTADEMSPSSPNAATEKIVHWIDINGDGLEDFVFAQTNGTGTVPSYQWIVRLNKGGTLGAAMATGNAMGLGTWGNTSSGGAPVGTNFRYSSRIAPIDVDSDGREELLVPVRIGAMFCSRYYVPPPPPPNDDCSRIDESTSLSAGDLPPCRTVTLCPVDPVSGNEIVPSNSDIFNAYARGSPGWDQSTYVMHPLRFVVGAVNGTTGLPTITVQEVQKDLYGDQVDDLYGDGLTDVLTSIGCADCVAYANNATPNTPSTLPDGTSVSSLVNQAKLFANENVGIGTQEVRPPELMHAVFNGVNDWAAWGYAPLGRPTQTGTVQPLPLYTLGSGTPYVDARHHYFTSSMPVVEIMTQSSAAVPKDDYTIAAGVRSRTFSYQEAMYHRLGRGFQGFRKITETTWVDDDLAARRQQVATTYHQKFPLTGKVQSVAMTDPAHPSTPYRTETWTWRCNRANRAELCPGDGSSPAAPAANTVYAPYLDRHLARDFDLASAESGVSALASEVDTVNAASAAATVSGWDAYGNLKDQIVTSRDGGSGGTFVASQTVTTASTYAPDTTTWWLDKLAGRTVSTAISYASGHALPAGASAPARSLTTTYQWNADRTPHSQTVQPGVANQERVTNWGYPSPSYGLPTSLSVSGSAVAPSARTTLWTYTGDGTSTAVDGYFVLRTTNAAGQATRTERRPRDGGIAQTTDPNGLRTVFNVDAFGRTYRTDYFDAADGTLLPSQYTSWTACADGGCPGGGYAEGAGEDYAAWRVTTTQAGQPATVTWYDKLGRVVKNVVSGFNGPVVTRTEYDVMGTVKQTSTPHYVSQAPYWTTFDKYDRLNRVTQKTAPGAELSPTRGDVRTTYTYTGATTAIKIRAVSIPATCSSATNLCMDMTRSYDVLGRLVKTTQALNGDANYATSKYWYDGAGNPVAAQDAEGYVTRASYDALGRRTQVFDPDAGTSNFTYDALGELLTRSDARGVLTTSGYDALGRIVRRTAVPPASAPTGLASDTVLDTWSYDPANGVGQLATQKRLRGPNRTSPDANPEVWRESYAYEADTSRPSTTTTRNAEGAVQVFTATQHYDAYGRPDVHTYPSGLSVRRGYTDQGHLKRLGNEATGVEYWSASAANAWGHVTQESWNSVSGSHVDYASTGQTYRKSWIGTGGSDQVTYGYDSFGNLVSQQRSLSSGGAPTESYVYDGLQRLTQASRPAGSIDYGYTKSGNLARKTDYSTSAANAYQYGGNGCGPHAVSQVQRATGAATFQCDASGNLIGGSTIQATYDAWNLPRTLMRTQIVPGTPPCRRSDTIFCSGFEVVPSTTTNGSTSWTYASDGSRSSEQSSRGLRLYGRNGYEQIGALKVHELGPVVVTRSGTTDTVTAVLKDRLDSTVATIDAAVNRRSYDPFGAVRNGDYATRPNGTLNLAGTIHGFTGHTHADDVALIHMNGRIYDPNLGRFLSVDPVVQFPASTQSLNPYSYLMNNPMAGRDPSGYAQENCVTGTHLAAGDCGGLGVSVAQIGTPSASEMRQSAAQALSAQSMATMARNWNDKIANGADGQTSKGPASQPTGGNPNDIGTNGKTVGGDSGVRTDGAIGLDSVRVTPNGASVIEYAVAYERWIWPDWQQEKNAWEGRMAVASGYDMIRGFYRFQWELWKSQFTGDVPAVGIAGVAGGLTRGASALENTAGASSAANAVRLEKQLASQAQMGEVGGIMAGPGGRVAFRDAQRIAQQYGGNAADWVKKSSSSFLSRDGTRFETHWVENIRTGQRVEFKTKFSGEE